MPDDDYDLGTSNIDALFDVAKRITPEPDEQVWIVTHAVLAGRPPELLEPSLGHVPAPLGLFDGDDPVEVTT